MTVFSTLRQPVEYIITLNGREPIIVSLSTSAALFVLYFLYRLYRSIKKNGFTRTVMGFWMGQARKFGLLSGTIDSEGAKIRDSVRNTWSKEVLSTKANLEIPKEGLSQEELLGMVRRWSQLDRRSWDGTKAYVSGSVYHGDDLAELQKEVFALYAYSNPLHPDQFEFSTKMESEIVAMTRNWLWGDEDVVGVCTSGGTESIMNAVKTFRDWGRSVGITQPEIVAPMSVHAAFDKACYLMGLELIKLDVDMKTGTVNMKDVRRAVNSNTVALVGSAPNYPYGIVDPIEEMAALAKSKGIKLHVDCCLGSYLLPMFKRMGRPVPKFGFDVDGVSTISIDNHKYGYSCKGSSVLLFRNAELRKHCYFSCVEWVGGIYITPTIPGSRPGCISACTWAVMMHLGQNGYERIANDIAETVDCMRKGIDEIPELQLIGNPCSSVLSFGWVEGIDVKKYNVYYIAEALMKHGWSIKKLQHPAVLHVCVTNVMTGKAPLFVDALKKAVTEVLQDPDQFQGGEAAMYAAGVSIPDTGTKSLLLINYLDAVLEGPLAVQSETTKSS
jgi:sphinganine-1-phosphate aldolase